MTQINTGSAHVPQARKDGQTLVVAIAGDIDLNNSPQLRTTLLGLIAQQQPQKLVLNLQRVSYMDSSAIAVLVELLRQLGRGRIALTDLQPRVKGLLEIARLDSIFTITANEQEALAK